MYLMPWKMQVGYMNYPTVKNTTIEIEINKYNHLSSYSSSRGGTYIVIFFIVRKLYIPTPFH